MVDRSDAHYRRRGGRPQVRFLLRRRARSVKPFQCCRRIRRKHRDPSRSDRADRARGSRPVLRIRAAEKSCPRSGERGGGSFPDGSRSCAKMCVARSTSVTRQRLTPKRRDIDSALPADIDRMHARRLSPDRMHAGRIRLDVLAIAEQPAEKSHGHGAAANVAGTDKKDVFHDDAGRGRRQPAPT